MVRTAQALCLIVAAAAAQDAYEEPFFPGATYDESVPAPDKLLGYRLGSKAATHAEIAKCLRAWDRDNERTRLVEYGRTHEGRALYYLVVSAPENMRRLDAIKKGWQAVASAARAPDGLPAVAWMGYCIHGDELSGSDAALAVAHHLAACRDDGVAEMLKHLVVVIDPLLNPDGRDRFIKMVREHEGRRQSTDNQSLLHRGYWPAGRTNHYLFDLNRDWILAVHPETQGRLRALRAWHPLLLVDVHEMGSQDTYLFNPPREPVNPHMPASLAPWWSVFSTDQARAFDRFGWRYYTREWYEEWYPGYSNGWAGYRGAIGILHEQASIGHDAVRRPEGTLLTYRESVHHQVVGSMANLDTLWKARARIAADFAGTKRAAVAADGPYAGRTFALMPRRHDRLTDLLLLQGISVYTAGEDFEVDAVDRLGRAAKRTIRKGALLVPNRQPLGHLVAAMLEFDPRMSDAFLRKERREILRTGRSRLYDVTAWSLAMMHDVEAYQLATDLPANARPYARPPRSTGADRGAGVAWVIDGARDVSLAAAAQLMEQGVQLRVATKAFAGYPSGSILVARADNPRDPFATLDRVCRQAGVKAALLATGRGEGGSPDLGGRYFPRLEPPRIALLTRGRVRSYDFGAVWHLLDHRFGVRVTLLDAGRLGDLRRYNVLIAPEGAGEVLDRAKQGLQEWLRAGGTLVAIGSTAASLAKPKSVFTGARRLRDVLEELDTYELRVLREWAARTATIDEKQVWSHTPPDEIAFPWGDKSKRPDKDERKRRDEWQRMFMPQGAILAGRTDDRHWLTCGLDAYVPVLFRGRGVLMAAQGIDAPVRLGVLSRNEERKEPRRAGWASIPRGFDLHLRMSGLLWPEAAARVAHSAYLTREAKGNGQVILFAAPPVFRGSTLGTARLFLNAVLLGPGLGARHPIR